MHSDQARGVLLGLACGDALGRPVEFRCAPTIAIDHDRLDAMIGYGTWNQPAGTNTAGSGNTKTGTHQMSRTITSTEICLFATHQNDE